MPKLVMRSLLRETRAQAKLLMMRGRFAPTVLMYHSVGRNAAHFNVTPESFHRQLKFLKDGGFKVVSLDECVRASVAGERGKLVALTFDDGYADFVDFAWPELKSFGFPATVFLITGSMGDTYTTSTGVQIPLMTWEDAVNLKKEGVDFGSHTVTHAELNMLSLEDAKNQLIDSQAMLRERLGLEKMWLCYPRGKESDDVRALAKDAGYLGAVTIEAGHPGQHSDPFGIPRPYVHSEMGMKEFEALFV